MHLIPNDIRFASKEFSQKDFPLADNGPFLCVKDVRGGCCAREAVLVVYEEVCDGDALSRGIVVVLEDAELDLVGSYD